MKHLIFTFIFAIVFGIANAQLIVKPTDSNVLVEGRTILKDGRLHFCYPGTAFTIHFTGSSVKAKLRENSGYYVYSIDNGNYQKKISTETGGNSDILTFTLAENLPAGEHTVKLMLVTEAYQTDPEFVGFELNNGAKLLKPITKKKVKIEIIGNSITCGYGVEANGRDDHFADSTSNFAKSYAGLTLKNLDAISMVVARSGIGIYKNYGDVKTGSAWPMPRVYENALISDTTVAWNFSQWSPDIVIIALGTNDLSEDNYDYEKFALAHIAFLKKVRSHYKSAKIVLLNSPMLHYQQSLDLLNVITNSQNAMSVLGDSRIYSFSFPELSDSPEDYGADWHPSAARARDYSRLLTYFIQNTVLKKKSSK